MESCVKVLEECNRHFSKLNSANKIAHMSAWDFPRRGFESAIVGMIKNLATLADAHHSAYSSLIGEDSVLGPEWLKIASGVRGMLNGNCGRLDCGTLDSMLCEMARVCGFETDEF